MRPKNMQASLGETMGKAAEKSSMTLADLPDILGPDKVMDMPKNRVGRHRLLKGLQQRFGNGYRNMPGVMELVKEFDEEIEFTKLIEKMRVAQPKKKGS